MINVTYENTGAVREFACVGHAGYTGGGGDTSSVTPVPGATPSPQGEGLRSAAEGGGSFDSLRSRRMTESGGGDTSSVTPVPGATPSPQGEGLRSAADGGGSFDSLRSRRMTETRRLSVTARTSTARPYESGCAAAQDDKNASLLHNCAGDQDRPYESGCAAAQDDVPAGGDIVCAAASALCGGLVATLLKHDEEFFSLFVTEDDGECRVTCAGEAAKPYFEFALVGLTKLAEAFPQNVSVRGFNESGERV